MRFFPTLVESHVASDNASCSLCNSTGFCFHVRAIAHRPLFLPLDMKENPKIQSLLDGDYHGAEPWLYSESLRRNIRARIRSFRN